MCRTAETLWVRPLYRPFLEYGERALVDRRHDDPSRIPADLLHV